MNAVECERRNKKKEKRKRNKRFPYKKFGSQRCLIFKQDVEDTLR